MVGSDRDDNGTFNSSRVLVKGFDVGHICQGYDMGMKHWNRGFGLGLFCFGEQTHRSGKACCSANSDATKLTRLSCEPTLVVDPQLKVAMSGIGLEGCWGLHQLCSKTSAPALHVI